MHARQLCPLHNDFVPFVLFAVAARMIDFDDKRWEGLKGGYKIAYDPRPALRELESGNPVDPIWDELWEDLHHQDTIGEASYAAVPHLVRHISRSQKPDWNPYGLVAVPRFRIGWPTDTFRLGKRCCCWRVGT